MNKILSLVVVSVSLCGIAYAAKTPVEKLEGFGQASFSRMNRVAITDADEWTVRESARRDAEAKLITQCREKGGELKKVLVANMSCSRSSDKASDVAEISCSVLAKGNCTK